MLLASGLGLLMPNVPSPGSMDNATALLWLILLGALLIAMFGLLGLSLIAFLRPPRWLRPAWLLEDETRLQAGFPSLVPLPPEGERPVIGRLGAAFGVALTVGIPTGVAFLGWPPSLLIGLGVAIPVLAAARLNDRRDGAPRGQ
jgi:hypothetical protein